jgi:hypothetical protein
MAKKDVAADDTAIPAFVRVKFLTLWSSDRGVFLAGAEAELPENLAQSLMDERVVEVL